MAHSPICNDLKEMMKHRSYTAIFCSLMGKINFFGYCSVIDAIRGLAIDWRRTMCYGRAIESRASVACVPSETRTINHQIGHCHAF